MAFPWKTAKHNQESSPRPRSKVQPFGPKAHAWIMRDPRIEKKFTLLVGSVRSSKTWAVTAKMIVWLCKNYGVEGRRVICGKTKETVRKNILIDLFEIVGKQNCSYNSSTGELWLFGSQWFVMGAADESSFTKILGMTIGIFIGDEVIEYPRSFFMQIPLRMSPDGARAYFTTNPGNPSHYLKTEVIDNPDWAPMLEVLTFTLEDNPNISDAAKQSIIVSQAGTMFLRYIRGAWVSPEGAIYKDCWSDDLLYDESTRPVTLYASGAIIDNLVGIDYGTAHPLCALEAIDDGHTLWIDREYWWDSVKEMRQKTDSQYADDLTAWLGQDGYKASDGEISRSSIIHTRRGLPRFIVDPSAASFKVELEGRGFWVIDAQNEVSMGIRRVSTLMNKRLVRVHRRCVNLIREIPGYAWDDKKVKLGEEEPKKINDDASDAMRYTCMESFSDYRTMLTQ